MAVDDRQCVYRSVDFAPVAIDVRDLLETCWLRRGCGGGIRQILPFASVDFGLDVSFIPLSRLALPESEKPETVTKKVFQTTAM